MNYDENYLAELNITRMDEKVPKWAIAVTVIGGILTLGSIYPIVEFILNRKKRKQIKTNAAQDGNDNTQQTSGNAKERKAVSLTSLEASAVRRNSASQKTSIAVASSKPGVERTRK